MPGPNEPARIRCGACPICASKNLRRIREGEYDLVVVQQRACQDCGTVFLPAVSPLLALVTVPLAIACFTFSVWALFLNDEFDPSLLHPFAGMTFLSGLGLIIVTAQVFRMREPKIRPTPQGREPKPWDNSRGEKEDLT